MSAGERVAEVLGQHIYGEFLGGLSEVWTTCSCGEVIDATFGGGRSTVEVFRANWGAHLAAALAAVLAEEREKDHAFVAAAVGFELTGESEFGVALSEALDALLAEERARALNEAADKWQVGAWSDVLLPKPVPPANPVIDYSNRVLDWLRARAEAEHDGTPQA